MTKKHSFKIIVIIALLVALGPMATDMYLPSLPTLTKALNTTTSNVQLTLSIYFFGFAIGQLIYGPLSDRYGRKPVLQIGLVIFVISSAIASMSTTIEALIVARLFQAIGGCAGPVLGRAMVRDMFTPEESGRVLSHIASAMALAPAIAPIIGSFLTVAYGWQSNFWFLFAYGLLALATLTFYLAETNKHKNPDAMKIKHLSANYKTIIKNQEWRLYTLICSFVFAGLFAFLSSSSFVLITYMGVTEYVYSYLFAIIIIGYIIGSQLSARLSKLYGAFTLIHYGSALALFSGVIMFLLSLSESRNVAIIIAPHFFFMIAVGITMPLSMAGALSSFPKMAGSASALLGFTQMMLAAIFGITIGSLQTSTASIMAGGIAVAGLLTYISMTRLKHIIQKSKKVGGVSFL